MSRKLNTKELMAVQMIARGTTGKQVANQLKVTPETVSRWRKKAEFRAELNGLIEEMRESTRNKLVNMNEKALKIIEMELDSEENTSQRIQTAFKVLRMVGTKNLALPEEPLVTDSEKIRKQDFKEQFLDKIMI